MEEEVKVKDNNEKYNDFFCNHYRGCTRDWLRIAESFIKMEKQL